MRVKKVREVRESKRALLPLKPLHSKALRGYMGKVRELFNIDIKNNIYNIGYLASAWSIILSYPYLLAICINYRYLGGKRKSNILLPLLQMIKGFDIVWKSRDLTADD